METTVYQLVASGDMAAFNQKHEVRSGTVFRSEEAANSRIDKFRKMVTDATNNVFALADNERLIIKAVPLIVVD